jgi:hypothetical protein
MENNKEESGLTSKDKAATENKKEVKIIVDSDDKVKDTKDTKGKKK